MISKVKMDRSGLAYSRKYLSPSGAKIYFKNFRDGFLTGRSIRNEIHM